MKSIATLCATLLFSLCALGAEPTNRPIGVEAENWIPLTDSLGFVVVATTEPAIPLIGATASRELLLNKVSPEPPAAGYFMVKSGDDWRLLVVMTPAEILRSPQRAK